MSQIQIRDQFDNPIVRMDCRLSLGDKPTDEAYDDKPSDFAGNLAFPLVQASPSYTLYFNTRNVLPQYQAYTHKHNGPIDAGDIKVNIPRVTLPKLTLNGKYLNVFLKGHTDFLLYKRYLDGENINPLLNERMLLGSNCARIFGMVNSFSHWHPQDYGMEYYDKLPNFLKLLNDYGMYCYFCVFADTQHIMPNQAQMLQHWERVIDSLSMGTNSIVELVNEPNQHENTIGDRNAFPKPLSMISVCGDFGDDYGGNVWPDPQWDLTDYHAPRDVPKSIKDLCSADNPNWLFAKRGVMQGEPDKFGRDKYTGKIYKLDPLLAKEMAGTSRGTNAGIIFHSTDGVYSDPFSTEVMECAKAWFKELEGA